MPRSFPFLAALLLALPSQLLAWQDAAPIVTVATRARAILKAHCWQCHGEEEELKGGLDLRLVRSMEKGGDSGPAIVAGKHAESLLHQRVASGEMPPGKKKL